MAGRAEESERRAPGRAVALDGGLDEAEDEKQTENDTPRPFRLGRLYLSLYFLHYFRAHIGPAIRPSSLFGAYSCPIQHPRAFQQRGWAKINYWRRATGPRRPPAGSSLFSLTPPAF